MAASKNVKNGKRTGVGLKPETVAKVRKLAAHLQIQSGERVGPDAAVDYAVTKAIAAFVK